MTYRPLAVFRNGQFELGLELIVENGILVHIGPQRGMPSPYLISPLFTNAHSHWEYRGLEGKVQSAAYWDWLREITQLKTKQSSAEIKEDCRRAATENVRAGIGIVGEHSDQAGSETATQSGPKLGTLYHEVITVGYHSELASRLDSIEQCFATKRDSLADGWRMGWAPHAPFTVDPDTLKHFANKPGPKSIHVAESDAENELFERGVGPIAEFLSRMAMPIQPTGGSAVSYVLDQGYRGPETQFVHLCSISDQDIENLARAEVTAAHCPRSNIRLGCRTAPIRRMLKAGIQVGIGLDSAASSGPIDMLAEMQSAYQVALQLGEPLTVEQVWTMATSMGARSLGFSNSEFELGQPIGAFMVPIPSTEEHERWLLEAYSSGIQIL